MTSIIVEDLGKNFRQYLDRGSMLARLAGRGERRKIQDVWALRHLDFTVDTGTTLGVIGRNGSGKTTLLRLLSGVSGPTEGRLRIHGRIASLIGVGVGFNRELTGRENVTVNGRLLGMGPAEVAAKYDTIVEFAELEEFMDMPVKFYSTGMFLRLAFAVAIHTEPDVLLVDEILAVGDIGFQTKCFDRMAALQDAGTTVVVVTHNLQVIQRLTERILVLDHGRMRFDGATDEALATYHEILQEQVDRHPTPAHRARTTHSNIASVAVTITGPDGIASATVRNREPMILHVDATFTEDVADPVMAVLIDRPGVGRLFSVASTPRGREHVYGPHRPLRARVRLDDVPLLPATYSAHVELRGARDDIVYGMRPTTLFHVVGNRPGAGSVDFGPHIEIDGDDVPVVMPRLRDRQP